ncbi:MAG: AraC family transcriptional regulator [Stenotrophobium sp.]
MAASWDYPRNICSVRVLTELGADHGMSVTQCLAGTRIDAARLQSHDAEVSAHDELQVIRNLLTTLGNDLPLSLDAGMRYHPTTFGVWGFMILSSASVRTALELGLRYIQLTSCYSRIKLIAAADEVQIIASDDELPPDVTQFLVERDGAMLMTLAKDLLPGNLVLTRVETKYSRPRYVKRATELFGREVSYGQDMNRTGISLAVLDQPLSQRDAPMCGYFEAECKRLLERHRHVGNIVAKVRERLHGQPGRVPTMHSVAAEFKETTRTLRRRLDAAGATFETLADEVRQTRAEQMLLDRTLKITEIAERLGYSEPSSFIRAFKRWRAMSPQRYRQARKDA